MTAPGMPGEDVPFVRRATEFVELIESEIAQLGVSDALLKALDKAASSVREAENESHKTAKIP
ncbi:unnamed protein product [Cylicostephanus goldi]|uniref:Uncharacterized protein n=1 Tax=Cylicostephanus goldi TaxID=71465 RepID=A0A3P7NGP1_CYLGO|nr:unnamed protein product [Cylicostephanus goldi]